MDDPELNCSICEEKYMSDRLPRNLTCGHSFCTICLDQILHLDKKCPECRADISSESASDLPVNYPVLRLSRSLSGLTTRTEAPQPCSSGPDDSGLLPGTEKCNLHGSALSYMCMKCNSWICQDCLATYHRKPPHGQCRILFALEALKELKSSHKMTVKENKEQAKGIREKMINEVTSSNENHIRMQNNIERLEDKIKELNNTLKKSKLRQTQMGGRISELDAIIDMMEQSEDVVNEASSITEITTAMEIAEDCKKYFISFKMDEKLKVHLRSEMLLMGTDFTPELFEKGDLKNLLNGGCQVYATLNEAGKSRFALVALNDDQALLYSLQDGSPPPGEINVPFKVLLGWVPRSSTTVFMEIRWRSHTGGRVYVNLFGDMPRCRQTAFLCSGELGPSYRNTVFYECYHRVNAGYRILRGGDYENNDGSGGKAIVQSITDRGIYLHDIVAGLMVSWPAADTWRLGSFDFYLDDAPGRRDVTAHGIVIKGLEFLTLAASVRPITSACVKDCGLVIPF